MRYSRSWAIQNSWRPWGQFWSNQLQWWSCLASGAVVWVSRSVLFQHCPSLQLRLVSSSPHLLGVLGVLAASLTATGFYSLDISLVWLQFKCVLVCHWLHCFALAKASGCEVMVIHNFGWTQEEYQRILEILADIWVGIVQDTKMKFGHWKEHETMWYMFLLISFASLPPKGAMWNDLRRISGSGSFKVLVNKPASPTLPPSKKHCRTCSQAWFLWMNEWMNQWMNEGMNEWMHALQVGAALSLGKASSWARANAKDQAAGTGSEQGQQNIGRAFRRSCGGGWGWGQS